MFRSAMIFSSIIGLATNVAFAGDSTDFHSMLTKATPAVVEVMTLKRNQSNELEQGLGTGTLFSKEGYLLTNYHVVDGVQQVFVRLYDQREFPATVIGYDSGTDLALLKIKANNLNLPYFNLDAKKTTQVKADGSFEPALEVGQWVVAIGSPFGFNYTVTRGIVSALDRTFPNERYVPFIQSDVSINPGNSGGPLLNLSGDLVGMNSQIVSDTGNYSGLSFSIPVKVIDRVYHQLKENGIVKRVWLGVVFQDLDRDLAESFGLDKVKGALISKVVLNSPAQKAGLKEGDIILQFNHKDIIHPKDISPIVGLLDANTHVPVQIIRNGKITELEVRVLASPQVIKKEEKVTTPVNYIENKSAFPFGIKIGSSNLPAKGVVVELVQAQAWKEAKVREKDVIVSVNGTQVKSAQDFYTALQGVPKGQRFHVLVIREADIQYYLPVLLP